MVTLCQFRIVTVCRANQRQQLGKGPVRGRAAPLEQSSSTENEGPGTHRAHILRRARLPPNEFYRLPIAHRLNNASDAAGYADQIQARAVFECVRRHEAEAAVAWYRICRFCDDVHCRLRQPRQDLLQAGEVELG